MILPIIILILLSVVMYLIYKLDKTVNELKTALVELRELIHKDSQSRN